MHSWLTMAHHMTTVSHMLLKQIQIKSQWNSVLLEEIVLRFYTGLFTIFSYYNRIYSKYRHMTYSALQVLTLTGFTALAVAGCDWETTQYQGTCACVPFTSMFQDLFTPLVPAEARALLSAACSLQATGRHTLLYVELKLVGSRDHCFTPST